MDDLLKLRLRVETQPHRNAEAVAQRIGEEAGARRRADERERRQIDLDRARRRLLPDDEVELEILHGRIEDFLDRRIEPVNLVDEQDIALLEIGEERREVAGLAITGPDVARKFTPSSRATIWASVVLPSPGGPTNSTWSSASWRARAAAIKTARFERACCWPMNSTRRCGRSDVLAASSSRRSAVTSLAVEAAVGPGARSMHPHNVRSRLYLFGSSSPIAAMAGPFAAGTMTRALRS